MKINVDWQLLSILLGFNELTETLWENIMKDKTEEEKTFMVESYISTYLVYKNEIEIDVED